MAAAGDVDRRLPPFVKFTKLFPGALLKLERVQKLLKTLQAVEGKSLSSVESFVGLLQPSPTIQQILDEFSRGSSGGRGESESEDGIGVGGGNKVEEVLRKLDKVMGEVEVKAEAEEDVRMVLEMRLRDFEDEVEMPTEGRGGLSRLIMFTQDVTAEAFVMFLAIFYHSVGESSTRKDE